MMPEQFWGLTPVEIRAILAGGSARDEREWERAAFIAATVMNMAGKVVKKPVTPGQLLGRKEKIEPRWGDDLVSKEMQLRERLEQMFGKQEE